MKLVLCVLFLASGYSAFAGQTLIECEGSGNRNAGEVKIFLNNETGFANILISTFNRGTVFRQLSNVPVNLKRKEVIDHIDSKRGLRVKIDISSESLVDGSNTIRPFPKRSRVYIDFTNTDETLINSRKFECKTYNLR